MRIIHTICLFSALLISYSCEAQYFAKIFSFGPSNPMANTNFNTCAALRDSSGYLILADRYTTVRNAMLIKTDTALNEIWSTSINFQNSPPPYDNVMFYDIGEMLNGNYFALGLAASTNHPSYVLFLFDTAGQVIKSVSIRDTANISSIGLYPQVQIGIDSSLIIGVTEYERFGFLRFDQNLNLLSSGHYTSIYGSWGIRSIMLNDTTLLVASDGQLTKTTANGNVIWSYYYGASPQIRSIFQSPGGSIYAGGFSTYTGPAVATLEKFDANGNPVFVRDYIIPNTPSTNAVWNIYPCGNDLLLYSDTVMFVVDTNGNVKGWGHSVNAYNYKYLRPEHGKNFIICGLLYQDSLAAYAYTMMRFDDSTSSGCLHLRNVYAVSDSGSFAGVIPQQLVTALVVDTVPYFSAAVQIGYDLLNGCPDNTLAIEEHGNTGWQLYPNPASENLTVKTGSSHQPFAVYDAMGRTVLSGNSDQDGTILMAVSDWPEGIYILVSGETHNRTVNRFVVQH